MKKVLLVIAAFAMVFAIAPAASARSISNLTNQSTANLHVRNSMYTALSVTNTSTVKNIGMASTYTGSNTISSTGDMDTVSIVTATADSAIGSDDLANSQDSEVTVDTQGTQDDFIEKIYTGSAASLEVTALLAGSDATSQNVDMGNNNGSLSNTGSNSVSSGAKMNNVTITTAPGQSAATTISTSGIQTRLSRIRKVN